jgi:hypothetical protein
MSGERQAPVEQSLGEQCAVVVSEQHPDQQSLTVQGVQK